MRKKLRFLSGVFLQTTKSSMSKWEAWLPSPWKWRPLRGGLGGTKEFEGAEIEALSAGSRHGALAQQCTAQHQAVAGAALRERGQQHHVSPLFLLLHASRHFISASFFEHQPGANLCYYSVFSCTFRAAEGTTHFSNPFFSNLAFS